jgi:hypothetical protein
VKEKIQKIITKLTASESIFFKQHCVERMVERDITSEYVVHALLNCEIIKEYPDDRPLVSYLVLGYDKSNKPLHIAAQSVMGMQGYGL